MAEEPTIQTQETTTVSNPHQVIKTTTAITPPIKTEHPQQVFEKKKTIFRTYQIIWYVLAVVETLLAFRMGLKALGASEASGFTNLIYVISNPFALPFSGILPSTISGPSILEWSNLVAVIVYALLAYGLTHLLQMAKPVTPKEVEQKVDN